MSPKYYLLTVFLFAGVVANAQQLFTMSNKCLEQTKKAAAYNENNQYDSAFNLYNSIQKSCNSNDAKEIILNGKAHALNGMKKYDDAIRHANDALKLTKNKSINAYFERGMAYTGKKDITAARADFARIIDLTEKNQNVKERATIYAMVGDLYWKSNMPDSANEYLDKAIFLDPSNPDFIVQKGDMAAKKRNYEAAFKYYDKAVEMGKTDIAMYKIRAGARTRQMQQKYGTTNAQELRRKMTPKETELVCTEVKKLISLGYKDMATDMFASLVCQ